MTQQKIERVLVMAHGWGYNHRFFNPFLSLLPASLRASTLLVCLESGYFPEQGNEGLMIHTHGEWVHHPAEALHSLVLAHAEAPWLGLGHSLGLSKLLGFSLRWHSLFSLHGFTHFIKNDPRTEGTSPRVLARMIRKAEQNMAEVLTDFQNRCGHNAQWASLSEHTLLADLIRMQTMDSAHELETALSSGADFYAWASEMDQIVPLPLAKACFDNTLQRQGRTLHTPAVSHAGFGSTPALYTDMLLPLLSPL